MPQTNPISWISIFIIITIIFTISNSLILSTNFTPIHPLNKISNPNNINW